MQAEDITRFKSQLRGDLIEPHDPRYDTERQSLQRHDRPETTMIVKCADVADVMASIHFARTRVAGFDSRRRP